MKKTLALLSLAALSALNAKVSDEKILSLFSLPGDVKSKIESRTLIEGTNYEQIVISFKTGEQDMRQVVFSDGKYIFPDVIDVEKGISHASIFTNAEQEKQKTSAYKKLATLLKSYPKDKIITLGSGKKESLYIFTDPLCPYCQEELAMIEERLKENDLKLIFTPIPSHGDDAIARSVIITKEVKNAKNDSDKINLLRKYYNKDNKAPELSQNELKKEKELIMSVFETGAVRGVPAIIHESELK